MTAPLAVVAGHICLDIIPDLPARAGGLADLLRPGMLVQVGPAALSTGGAVSNTGLALHRLGIPTRLMGRVGDDLFGVAVRELLRRHGPALADGLLTAAGEPTSYTVVVSPPGVDRLFLHCPGVNDTFAAADVPYDELRGMRLFHFGYPPIMRRMFADGGDELADLLRTARARGPAVSLDMAFPDPASDAGRADWPGLLARVLPHVDLFLPSIDEILFMLRHPAHGQPWDGDTLADVAARLLDCGAAVVGLKLGDRGFYVRTTTDAGRLERLAVAAGGRLTAWQAREILAPCFAVEVAGTTGCGDCTIAGFLAGLLHGQSVDDAATAAVAVGACCAERPDATSGVQPWDAVQARIGRGWRKLVTGPPWPGWDWDAARGLARGPRDGR